MHTKSLLREQRLKTILEQFDGEIMELSQSARRLKYEKMVADAFSFFRGSAYLFYYDVSNIPFSYHTPNDKPTWIMGDLHFNNFSAFQNEQGEIVFDVDDFDEGYLGSYLYDVLRMVVSIRLFANQLGFSESNQDDFVARYAKAYCKQLKKFAERKENPVTTRFTVEHTKSAIKKALKKLEERKATHELEKQTMINDEGERVFNREKIKLSSVSNNEFKAIKRAWGQYLESIPAKHFHDEEHYEIKDIVKKIGTGIGSTGLKRFYILIEGTHDDAHFDDIILEAKEARTPIPAYFFPYEETLHQHQGERVMDTQKAMHHMADPYLGYFTMNGRDFYVRERSAYDKDLKESHLQDYDDMDKTVKIMGKITAKIHARADEDIDNGLLEYHSEEEILKAIGDDKDGFVKELQVWSTFYQRHVEEDYRLFQQWHEQYNKKK